MATMHFSDFVVQMLSLLAAAGLIICLKQLASPKTARVGNGIGALGMLLAVVVTLMVVHPPNLLPILLVILLGSMAGTIAALRVEMTAMPQMVGLLNGLGGAATVLVSLGEVFRALVVSPDNASYLALTSWLAIVIGGVTLSGSLLAFGKLQGWIDGKPRLFWGQRFLTLGLLLVLFAWAAVVYAQPLAWAYYLVVALISLVLGVLLVTPIGGADMPVVISLLNSYSGMAGMAAGFVVGDALLIIAGSLVGASGIILTKLMCEAMNRSLLNVVFGAFGADVPSSAESDGAVAKEFVPMDAAMLLSNASNVVVVPGYGLAVSQAQHNLRELADLLKQAGTSVKYAVHPVAGRMPGHMNVLLAEADVPYEDLYDLEEINGEFENTDVVIVVGANDVVNPAAKTDKASPLYGMPVLNADLARAVIVLKRGAGRGFAGVDNPLFSLPQSGTVYGDAKKSIVAIIHAVKALA